ncbi:MAG: cytochrome c biogenesis protein CcdA [Candidatus Velthaea sp.]
MSGVALAYPTAFLAGGASFASPCVLPLVPAYLSFLAGVSYDELTAAPRGGELSRRIMVAALAFVAGFVAVFVALGASASLIGRVLIDHAGLLEQISGLLVIAFGLHFIGWLRVPVLFKDARFHPQRIPSGPLGAFLMGLAFAFGWTPCVGPILAAILTLAANGNSLDYGMLLLACYGLGLGVPFLLAAFAIGPFMRIVRRLRDRMRAIEISVGVLMVGTGALILTGTLASISGWLLKTFPALGQFG